MNPFVWLAAEFPLIVALWRDWIVPASLHGAVLAAILLTTERFAGRRIWPEFWGTLWSLVFLRLIVPNMRRLPLGEAIWTPSIDVALPTSSSGAEFSWFDACPFLWIAGVGTVGIYAWRRAARVRRSLLTDAVVAPGWLAEYVIELGARLGLREPPEVLIGDGVAGALLIGFRRPIVVVDASLIKGGPTVRLEHVLLHELAHLRRRDNWLILAAQAVQIVFWFHPGAWIARRQLSMWIEICCDRRATTLADRAEYRRTLLAMARPLFDRRVHGGLAFFASRSGLIARLESLSGAPVGFSWGGRAATALACVLAFSLLTVDCSSRVLAAVDSAHTAVGSKSVANTPATIDDFNGCLHRRYFILAQLAARERQSEQSIP